VNNIQSGLGLFKKQKISRKTPTGYFIEVTEGNAFLPDSEKEYEIGDETEIFIYHDYSGNLTATLTKPRLEINQTAMLIIKASGDKGAFADWGLDKDLFIPHAEQHIPLEKGKSYPVYAYIDSVSGRITGSTFVDKYIPDVVTDEIFKTGQEVNIIILKKTDLGYKVLINQKYCGLLYENELSQPVQIGDEVPAYIKMHREDGKIDISLRKPGYDEVVEARDFIYEKLKSGSGYLPFNDKSDPDEIRNQLGMSKRTFKAAVGSLLKENLVYFEGNGIQLK